MIFAEFYTYYHTRNDTGKVFYVGKGKGKRAWRMGRNPHWSNIAKKHGHTVHIAARWVTEDEAFDHEKRLIECLKELNVSLVNMTDGGEGTSGHKHSTESKKAISAAFKGKPKTPEHSKKVAEALTGRIGKPFSPESKAKRSKLFTGDGNGFFGRKHSEGTRKLISEKATGIVPSAITREKIGQAVSGSKNGFFGKTHTTKTLEKISHALSGELNYNFGNPLAAFVLISRRYKCLTCGMVTNMGNLTQHQRASRHSGSEQLLLSST